MAESKAAPLPRLKTLDARRDGAFRLSAIGGETTFTGGTPSATMGFNQPYLGPVVRIGSRGSVQAAVENRTRRTITVHWHGLLVPGPVDGGPHNAVGPGETWRPELPVDQPPATLWYHTHLHRETAQTVHSGLAGVLIVDDGRDLERGLPVADGGDDLVLVLQDKRLDDAGSAAYAPTVADALHGFLGNTIVVNGAVAPRAAVPAGIVRLRLVNASNGRNYDLAMSDGRPLHLIATEQGYLHRSAEVSRLRLTPGERAEALVDFAAGDVELVSAPHAETGGAGGMDHAMAAPVEDSFTERFAVVSFAVDRDLPLHVASVPATVGDAPAEPAPPVTTRRFVLNDMGMMPGAMMAPGGAGGHAGHVMDGEMMMGPMGAVPADPSAVMFGINGRAFDMDRLDHTAAAGTTERWIVAGDMMGHPFHIHGARFRVIAENGGAPRIENSGWKDTLFVEGEAEMLVEFPHPAPAEWPFMFHCHILEHEDRGMMGQFAVA